MRESTRERLTFFVRKAHRIRDSRFLALIQEEGLHAHVTFHSDVEGYTIEYNELNRDAVEGFILNFRFFTEYKEDTSLHSIDTIDDPDLSETWKRESKLVADWFKAYRAAVPTPTFVVDSKAITCKELMDTFLYGDYSHGSKRQNFYKWEKIEGMFPLMEHAFYYTVAETIRAISHLCVLAEQELARE